MQCLSKEQEIQISTRHYFMLQKVYILLCIEYQWFCETSVVHWKRHGACLEDNIQFLQGMAFGVMNMFYKPAGVRQQRLILLLNLNLSCLEITTMIDFQLDLNLS